MTEEETYKLGDFAIAHLAKLIQMAILTGTDVVDQFRVVEFKNDDGYLIPTEKSLEIVNSEIESMFTDLENKNTESENSSDFDVSNTSLFKS